MHVQCNLHVLKARTTMDNIFLSHSYILVFLPKSLFSITLILICITLSLVTLLGNHFSFHFIALCYKRNVMCFKTAFTWLESFHGKGSLFCRFGMKTPTWSCTATPRWLFLEITECLVIYRAVKFCGVTHWPISLVSTDTSQEILCWLEHVLQKLAVWVVLRGLFN